MKEYAQDCILCGRPLVYQESETLMECAICHRSFQSNACCEQGHFVCNECHTKGMDAIVSVCLKQTSTDPVLILEQLMSQPFCHMHGPEHHTMVGAALLTAYKNAGGELDLPKALDTMLQRGRQVPGGICGFWGSCGAAISCGICTSIMTASTPLSQESWGISNHITAQALDHISATGGPRCCKRDSYTAILSAVGSIHKQFGVELTPSRPLCTRFKQNRDCIGKRCPYSPINADKNLELMNQLSPSDVQT